MSQRGPMFQRLSVGAVGVLLSGGLVFAAVKEEGYRADHVTLHDNSVWVTKSGGLIGRFNYDLQLVDTNSVTFDPVRRLHQAESTVVVETESSKMFSYNVALNRADGSGNPMPERPALSDRSALSIGGEHGALLDATSGKVWFADRSGIASVVFEGPKETPGSVELAGADDLVVGADGTLHVLDVDEGVAWRFADVFARLRAPDEVPTTEPPSPASNVAATPETTLPVDLLVPVELGAFGDGYQLTTAAEMLVVLDGRELVLEDGSRLPLPASVGDSPKLQQPSAVADSVLIASEAGLARVSLVDGSAVVLSDHLAATPIEPVSMGGCDYAAWADAVFASCSSPELASVPVSASATFRSNRNRVVLNFQDGSLIAFPESEAMVPVDNQWADALDPNDQQDDTETSDSDEPDERENTCEIPVTNSPPVVPLVTNFRVRAGTSSTLDVLNPPGVAVPATDPDCDVLTVALDPEVEFDTALGQVSIVSQGRALQFQPYGEPGGASIEIAYLVSDGVDTVGARASVEVLAVDDVGQAPTANADRTTVEVGKTVVIDVLANDVDPDGDAVSVRAVTLPDPSDGTLVWQPGGRVAFTAPGAGSGTKSIEYVVADDHGQQATGVLEINVIPAGVKSPPNPRSDALLAMFTTGNGAPSFEQNVLINDSDPNGDSLRITEIAPYPAGAGAVRASYRDDGTVSITPPGPGSYNYVYTVVDTQGETAQSRVRFEIMDDVGLVAPVAVRDSVVVSSVRPTVLDVLRNDIDLNGDVLMVIDVTVPETTSDDLNIEVLDARYVRVSTKRSQPGSDAYTFNYTVSDGTQQSSTTVSVGIIPSGNSQPPVTLEDRGQVHLGGYVSIPVLLNDFDPNGIPLQVTDVELDPKVAAAGAPGTVFVQNNQVRYVPPTVAARQGPFTATGTYTVSNGRDRQNGRFTISVTDPSQNRPPSPLTVELRTFQDQSITFFLPSYGLDPDGDPVELVKLDGNPALRGTVAREATGAAFTYTPLDRETGSDSFRWQLRDSYDSIGYLDVRVVIGPRAVGNHPPVAVRDTAQAVIGQSVFIPVLANDTDIDPGDTITFFESSPYVPPNAGAGEVLEVTDDGFIAYQAPDVEGEYSFLYYITDGQSPRVQGLVTVVVTTADKIVNRPPTVKDIVLQPAREGELVTVDLQPYASDPEGLPLTFGPGDDAVALGATVQGSVLSVTMTREPMVFTFVVDDGADKDFRATGVIQVPVPKNQAPAAEVLEVEIGEDETTKQIDVSSSLFYDPDGDPVSIYFESDPTLDSPEASNGGDLKWDGDGFVFNRNPDFKGTAKINYYIVDSPPSGEAIVQPASIVLTILKKDNVPPTITDQTTDVISGTSSSFDLRSLVADIDPGDEANLVISDIKWEGPSSVTIATSGTIVTFTADIAAATVGEVVPGAVVFTVDDGRENGRVPGALKVNIKPTNLGDPVAVDDLQPSVKQGESPTWNLLTNDPPNGTGQGRAVDYQIVSITQPEVGTVTIVGTDSVKFSPAKAVSGQTSFTYTIEDRATRRATATVRFAVLDRPATPTQPTVGVQLSATAVVSFARPDDHGSPIDGFEVQRLINGNPAGGVVPCGASPCTLSGLTNGVEYTFRVRAHNEVDWSDWSDPSGPYTPDELPGVPPTPVVDWNDQTVTATWGAISNEGSEIIDVTVSLTPADAPPIVYNGGQTGGNVAFTGLNNGTSYTVSIVARNKKGNSPSSSGSETVIPAGRPILDTAPIFFADNGFVVALWPSADGNGDDDLAYSVELTDETAGSATVTSRGAATDANLPAINGHVYHVVVNVQNKYTRRYSPAGVNSPRSISDKAIGIPTAPTTITATAGAGTGAVNVVWAAANPAGGTISSYQVRVVDGGAWQDVGNVTSRNYSSGLVLGSSYRFEVRAINDNRAGTPGDTSAQSNAASPYTPPAQPSAGCSHNNLYTITCTWNGNGLLNGPGPRTVTIDGGNSSSSGSTNFGGQIGYNETRGITVRVCNGGTSGNNCSQNAASTNTGDHRIVYVSGTTTRERCDSNTSLMCQRFAVNLQGFMPGTYNIRCFQEAAYAYLNGNLGVGGSGTATLNMATTSPYCHAYSYADTGVSVDGTTGWTRNGGSWDN